MHLNVTVSIFSTNGMHSLLSFHAAPWGYARGVEAGQAGAQRQATGGYGGELA